MAPTATRRRLRHGRYFCLKMMVAAVTGTAFSSAVTQTGLARTFTTPTAPSRREFIRVGLLAPAVAAPLLGEAGQPAWAVEIEPLPPPVVKDVVKAAPKVQDGADWLFFEVKPALLEQNLEKARTGLGSPMMGSYVSPLETDLMIPLEQLISANVMAEEEGWIDAIREVRVAIDTMKEEIGAPEEGGWAKAVTAWDKARAGANKIMTNINERSEKPPFILLDAQYEKRAQLWLKKKKDKIAFTNQMGSIMLR
mmetsp:Transcript_74698/g.147987  ORF Transcript_74698/g.147987 Transcript_74698/m.147987 type:complete len:252 (-) Transcript_74698:286-1041(-)